MKLHLRLIAAALAIVMLLPMTACGCKHDFDAATCTAPATCSLCGESQGDALGHDYDDATCEEPETCDLCDKTKGDPLGHDFEDGVCTRCDKSEADVEKPEDEEPDDENSDDKEFFSIEASGEYSDGILLPELDDAHVTVMMSIDWSYLESVNDPEDPFAQYHAALIWRDAYADQDGDVEIITISDEQQTDYLATQTASGTAPDIINANYDLTYPKWNTMGLTAPISDYADHLELYGKNPNAPTENLYNLRLMEELFRWDGESHAAITLSDIDRNYIVYNKTKFEQAGQTDPLTLWQKGQWTWTNFVKTAKAMTSGDDYGFTGWGLFPYFAPYPMAKLDEATGKVSLNIDDPKYMMYMTEVYNLYQVDKAARSDYALQTWSTLFPNGIDAMVQTTKSGYRRIVEAAERIKGDEFGIAPVPAFDPAGETVGIATATLWGYSISAAAANPIGAAAYIRLETLVTRNIEQAFDGSTWYDQNLTDAEKEMLGETEDDPVCVDMIRGIGNCYFDIIDCYIVPSLYYVETTESVQAIFDAQRNALQAEFDEFNSSY